MKKCITLFTYIILINGIFMMFSCEEDKNPVVAGNHRTLELVGYMGISQGGIRSVAVSGDYAFLADTVNGLRIVDISDRTNPQEKLIYGAGGLPRQVFSSGKYLFVTGTQINGLNIMDMSTPLSPSLLKNLPNIVDIYDVQYKDSMLYIVSGTKGLLVYDLSNINHPDFCSSFLEGSVCRLCGVDVIGTRAYLADYYQAFRILDISNPDLLKQAVIIPMAGPVSDVCVQGDRAYLACAELGLFIYDVRDVKKVTALGSFVRDGLQINKMEVCSVSLLYVSDLEHSLSVLDVSRPSSCRQITVFSSASPLHGFCVDGDYIYLAQGEDGMVVLEYK
jgi:hypothetical protein